MQPGAAAPGPGPAPCLERGRVPLGGPVQKGVQIAQLAALHAGLGPHVGVDLHDEAGKRGGGTRGAVDLQGRGGEGGWGAARASRGQAAAVWAHAGHSQGAAPWRAQATLCPSPWWARPRPPRGRRCPAGRHLGSLCCSTQGGRAWGGGGQPLRVPSPPQPATRGPPPHHCRRLLRLPHAPAGQSMKCVLTCRTHTARPAPASPGRCQRGRSARCRQRRRGACWRGRAASRSVGTLSRRSAPRAPTARAG